MFKLRLCVKPLGWLGGAAVATAFLFFVEPVIVCVSAGPLEPQAVTSCPVTHPNQRPFPGATEARPGDHGNGELWINLPRDGKLDLARDDQGFLSAKIPWVRAVRGRLVIVARRTDASSSRPFRSFIPEGYKDIGFQPSILRFPDQGCWEIVGTVGTSKLRVVIEVREKGDGRNDQK